MHAIVRTNVTICLVDETYELERDTVLAEVSVALLAALLESVDTRGFYILSGTRPTKEW